MARHNTQSFFFPAKSQPQEKSFVSTLAANPKTREVAHTPSANFIASDSTKLEVGSRVEHQKFGLGEVNKLEGSAHNPVATITFEQNGEKKIMLNYAKLMIL